MTDDLGALICQLGPKLFQIIKSSEEIMTAMVRYNYHNLFKSKLNNVTHFPINMSLTFELEFWQKSSFLNYRELSR